jgi:hypothetical protein
MASFNLVGLNFNPSAFGKTGEGFGLAGRFANALNPQKQQGGFSPSTPQQWLEYGRNLKKQGFTPEEVNAAMQQFAPPAGSQSPEGKLLESLTPLMKQQIEQNIWANSPEGMKYQLELAREDAREKAKQGLMWGTLAKLPEKMANALSPFGGAAGTAMMYQGMSQIPSVYSQTLQAYPQSSYSSSAPSQYHYFQLR